MMPIAGFETTITRPSASGYIEGSTHRSEKNEYTASISTSLKKSRRQWIPSLRTATRKSLIDCSDWLVSHTAEASVEVIYPTMMKTDMNDGSTGSSHTETN